MSAIDAARKWEVRAHLANLVKDGDAVFNLPGEECLFERTLLHHNKKTITIGVEKNKDIYPTINKLYEDGLGTLCLPMDVFKFLENSSIKFDVIWLDLCSYFTARKFYDSLRLFRESKARVFGITFFLKRTQDMDEFKDIYGVKNTKELLNKFIELVNFYTQYKLDKRFDYMSGSSPMVTLIFKK
jgi:hypothetical protein